MIISTIQNLKEQYDEALPTADPRTRDWLLLWRNPVYVWGLTISYLLFLWLGTKIMRNRKPFSLKWPMVIYNLGLVALSFYMVVEILGSAWELNYGLLCAPLNKETRTNPKELRMAKVMWWYFFSKAIELNDTVLMVLRKKNNQITFLHVFHHMSMLNIWWWVMMFIPGGLSYFGSCLNCFVHVVMYSYYGLSVLPSVRGKLWFKHYITQFQLIQFCVTLTHSSYSIVSGCDFPRWGKNLLAGYMVFMLILFTNFYIHAYYMKNKKKHEEGKRHVTENGHQNGTAAMHEPNGNINKHRDFSSNGYVPYDTTVKRRV